MNPVLAGMCEEPADYKWSSCATRLARDSFARLDFDPLYTVLGKMQQEQADKYETFLAGTITDEEKQILLGAVQKGQLTGGKSFVDEIEQKLSRRIELRGQGRPKKACKINLSPFL